MVGPELKPRLEYAHQSPPESIKSLHKHYQKSPAESLVSDPRVLDFTNLSEFHRNRVHVVGKLEGSRLRKIFDTFESNATSVDGGQNIDNEGTGAGVSQEIERWEDGDRLVYEHELLPGMSASPHLRDSLIVWLVGRAN